MNNCRLLVDVDAIQAAPTSDYGTMKDYVENRPALPFHLKLTITTGDATATIDATYTPYTWDQFSECHNDGDYTEGEYPTLSRCIESLTPHEVVELN
ncbi:hypothetical protein KKF84_04200 [Myxococcota bacterium]|nr:hypothetical protein [Myxococcota bacterium]MBU1534497.1 hypothetical protein [Myxococcota bacterium]